MQIFDDEGNLQGAFGHRNDSIKSFGRYYVKIPSYNGQVHGQWSYPQGSSGIKLETDPVKKTFMHILVRLPILDDNILLVSFDCNLLACLLAAVRVDSISFLNFCEHCVYRTHEAPMILLFNAFRIRSCYGPNYTRL